MDLDFKRIIRREFPEIASGMHMPILAKIVRLRDVSTSNTLSDDYRPAYCADLRIVNAQHEVVDDLPVFEAVPLPVRAPSEFALVEPGTFCEVAFLYGLPSQLFIRHLFQYGQVVPPLDRQSKVIKDSAGVFEKTDNAGNKSRTTHGDITDESLSHTIESFLFTLEAIFANINIAGNSIETIGGAKLIEAMGALRLLSGGDINISAVDAINISTASDLNHVAAKDINEACGGIAERIAKLNNRLKVEAGGKIYIGGTDNILKVLSDTIQLISDLATATASHAHTAQGTSMPTNAADITQISVDVLLEKSKVDTVAE